jgi:hypothetical protein
MVSPLEQFKRRRRVALWLGIVLPTMLLLTAFVGRHTLSAYYIAAFVVCALLVGWLCTRQYRCPFCGGDPEEGEGVSTFYPRLVRIVEQHFDSHS